jgi:hypothetical protein
MLHQVKVYTPKQALEQKIDCKKFIFNEGKPMAKQLSFTCPVCGKPLTQTEYDKALGLWDEKQEHIKHLETQQRKLREQAKKNKAIVADERKKFREKELAFKADQAKLRDQTKKALEQQVKKAEQAIKKERALTAQKLKQQRKQVEASLKKQMQVQLKSEIAKGVEQQKTQLKKQHEELSKTKNKMNQLEKSLKLSADKYQQASAEIKKLKEQIQKGITPQIEGLLEEDKLLAKLHELFPQDKFEHPGKGGDIIQFVIEQGQQIGKIVYECKKVKNFDKKHIDQAKTARRIREADFAVLVTNVFPSKKQYYFVEKTVFVINPISLEPITQTLRDSLVRIFMLRLSSEAKSKAVQQVYAYLSSNEYSNKVNDLASQLMDLGKELKTEILSHKRVWEKRYKSYRSLYIEIGVMDHKLRSLINGLPGTKDLQLPAPPKQFIDIQELQG